MNLHAAELPIIDARRFLGHALRELRRGDLAAAARWLTDAAGKAEGVRDALVVLAGDQAASAALCSGCFLTFPANVLRVAGDDGAYCPACDSARCAGASGG